MDTYARMNIIILDNCSHPPTYLTTPMCVSYGTSQGRQECACVHIASVYVCICIVMQQFTRYVFFGCVAKSYVRVNQVTICCIYCHEAHIYLQIPLLALLSSIHSLSSSLTIYCICCHSLHITS